MQWHYSIKLSEQYHPQTIRDLLQKTWLLSRKVVHFLRINERVLINARYRPMNTVVQKGDQIDLTFDTADFTTPAPPFDLDLSKQPDVLFETNDLIVVNKPSGIKTHANQPHELGSMMNILQGYFKNTNFASYNVHRLDQWTSGALLVAKNPVVVPILSRQISQKIIQRTYLCIVEGTFDVANGTIDRSIGFDPLDQRKRQIDGQDALNAITHYRVLENRGQTALVQIQLETGRTHQIRVHMASIGHPVVGDPLYNPQSTDFPMRLHSWKIKFPLPFNINSKEIDAPIPNYFEK